MSSKRIFGSLTIMLLLSACGSIAAEPGAHEIPPELAISPVPVEPTSEPVNIIEALPDSDDEKEDDMEVREGAYLYSVELLILESFPVQIRAVLSGDLPDGCTGIKEIVAEQTDDWTFEIHIFTQRPADAMCTQALVPFEEQIALDVNGLPAGEYVVKAYDLETAFTLAVDNVLD